ncbi:carboxyl transferase domain-containing protein [Siccirubricoccus deserti]
MVIVGDDFTVRGGSADATIREKPIMAERMAAELRLPIIRIIEGSGGGGSVKTIETTGRANLPGGVGGTWLYHHTGDNLSRVPVVALGLGSVAGLGAARLAASHFSVMTKETSAMFVAGPPVVNALGNNLSKAELGGWEIQCKAGAVDHAVDSEEEAFEAARRFLSYLPGSVFELPRRLPSEDDAMRSDESWLSVIPRSLRTPYRARAVMEGLMDRGSVFEMGRYFGRSVITAFARLDGMPVAVIAGDPMFYAGSWTADACAKIIRFVDLAETFHLPVVHLMDCPGFMIGLEAEQRATIRWGVRAMAAINQCTVPWCTVVLRNAFGVAGAIHQPAGRYTMRYAWPSARWGSLPLEGDRGGLPRRSRRRQGPRRDARRNRDPAAAAAQSAADGRGVLGGGDHRPAADPPAALRVLGAGGAGSGAGPAVARHAAVTRHRRARRPAFMRQARSGRPLFPTFDDRPTAGRLP